MKIPAQLKSRKFWLVVFGVGFGILNTDPEMVQGLILAYLGAEGLADVAERYKTGGDRAPVISDPYDDVDTNKFISGSKLEDAVDEYHERNYKQQQAEDDD